MHKEWLRATQGLYVSSTGLGFCLSVDRDYIEISECTGCVDDLNNEIYVGDIIEITGNTIQWMGRGQDTGDNYYNEPTPVRRIAIIDDVRYDFDVIPGGTLKIIGNIYENPELANTLN